MQARNKYFHEILDNLLKVGVALCGDKIFLKYSDDILNILWFRFVRFYLIN